MKHSRRLVLLAAGIALDAVCAGGVAWGAPSSYLQLEGVPGESTPPGLGNGIAVDSLRIGSASLEVTKDLDSTSVPIQQAVVLGTPFPSAKIAFYNDVFTDPDPSAVLALGSTFATSAQTFVDGSLTRERVDFNFGSPTVTMFLELPGITGESSAPGYTGLIALDSVALSGNSFSVSKRLDSTSSALLSALLLGTHFSPATLLFFTNFGSESAPDFSMVFEQALVSSVTSVPENSEEVAFASIGVTIHGSPAPEPEAAPLLSILGLAGSGVLARMRRTRAER